MLLISSAQLASRLRRLLAETVSAFAELEAHMRLGATLWAFLLPGLASGFLDLWFGGSRDSEATNPGLVCLLDRALGMDATQRIRRFSANGT